MLRSQTLHHGAKKKSSTRLPRKSSSVTGDPEMVGSRNDGADFLFETKSRPCHVVTARKMARISIPFTNQRFQFPKIIFIL